MTTITVSVDLDATVEAVWAELADIESHVDWMADAEWIRFASAQREGPGTAFDCRTRIGPARLTDRMVVTEWDPGRTLAVEHRGLVTGRGRFTLEPRPGHGARLLWRESLTFPWWLAGPFGAAVARPVLTIVWRGNLRRFGERVAQSERQRADDEHSERQRADDEHSERQRADDEHSERQRADDEQRYGRE